MIRSLLLAMAVLCLPGAAAAQVSVAVETQKRVVERDAAGRTTTRLAPADRVLPGDEILYTVRIANGGDRPAEAVRFVTPIPPEMRYVDGSARAADTEIQFSVDGARSFGAPQQLFVTGPDGVRRPAQGSDYTHIAWRMTSPVPPAGRRDGVYVAAVR